MYIQAFLKYAVLVSLILFLAGCPYIEEYSNSGCLDNPLLAVAENDYPGCGNDEIVAVADGNSIHITHLNTTYNCCPDEIAVVLSSEGNFLKLREEEILTTPCDCLCCYNVEAEITGVLPGEYIVEVCWDDYETRGTLCDSLTVVVPSF